MLVLIGCGTFGLDSLNGELDTAGFAIGGGADTATPTIDSSNVSEDSPAAAPDDTAGSTEDSAQSTEADSGTDAAPADCGDLDIDWQPSVAADYTFYIEYTEADGDVAVPWVAVDAEDGLGGMGASLTVCSGSVRFIGAGDRDGDGADDTWSAMVSGDGCVEVGDVTCTWNGALVDDSTVRRSDGCSNICEVP